MGDYRQSREYNQYFESKGWKIGLLSKTNYLIKVYPVIGAAIRIQRGSPQDSIEDIDNLAKIYNASVVVIEPDITTGDSKYKDFEQKLKDSGFENFNMFLSPTKTTCIDLTDTEDNILAKFTHDIRKNTRINNTKNIEFKEETDLNKFYSLLSVTEHKQHIYVQDKSDWLKQWSPFGNHLRLVMAYDQDTLLGGNMFTIEPPTAYGLFLPITAEGRKISISSSLIWESMKIAKHLGCTTFDLNGLYDGRYNLPKNWQGLSNFKLKFKGKEKEFMPPMVKIYSKLMIPFKRLGLLWMFY